MLRTPPAPATKVKTIEQQNTDFTAEGSPPPGTVGKSIRLKAKLVAPEKRQSLGKPARRLPKAPDESINPAGAIPSEPMKQAARDIKRGLVDTDRGAEADRTYRKLKQSS